MSSSNAFCTARSPFALEMTTGFAAQRTLGGSGRGGRMGYGMSAAAAAATPTALRATNSRRDGTADTPALLTGGAWFFALAPRLSTCSDRGAAIRSEERRVGEEGRFRWVPNHLKKKTCDVQTDLS